MYPNISSNNRNNGALGCSRKEATSIVLKDIIPIEPLWHGLLNLSWPTQKTSGPLTNVKGIILFLQRQTPQPFSSLSHRGMNLDGSCFPPYRTPHFKHTLTIGWINLLPAPPWVEQCFGLDNPYNCLKPAQVHANWIVREGGKKKTSVPNFSHVTFSHSPHWVSSPA